MACLAETVVDCDLVGSGRRDVAPEAFNRVAEASWADEGCHALGFVADNELAGVVGVDNDDGDGDGDGAAAATAVNDRDAFSATR